MIELREYLDSANRSPFARWFNELDAQAAIRVAVALGRMEIGNFSNAKSVGEGVSEYRIDFGPGYRIYFGREGATLVILLGGGTKKRQQRDIEAAKENWIAFKKSRVSGAASWR
jgi:putative addiction module killer protein